MDHSTTNKFNQIPLNPDLSNPDVVGHLFVNFSNQQPEEWEEDNPSSFYPFLQFLILNFSSGDHNPIDGSHNYDDQDWKIDQDDDDSEHSAINYFLGF